MSSDLKQLNLIDLQRNLGCSAECWHPAPMRHCYSTSVVGSQQDREANSKNDCAYLVRRHVQRQSWPPSHHRHVIFYDCTCTRYYMQQLTPHDPTFFWICRRDHKVATSIFSAPIDNVSSPAARFLHRTPYPVAWCPWVSPTGVETALSSMSWQHHFIAIKFKISQ